MTRKRRPRFILHPSAFILPKLVSHRVCHGGYRVEPTAIARASRVGFFIARRARACLTRANGDGSNGASGDMSV